MNEQASAILLNWKRPWNIRPICESLLALPFCSEVICWDNSGTLQLDMPGVTVVRSHNGNVGTFGRFLAAQEARHGLLLTQDDDVLVENWPDLYGRFMDDGERLVAGLSPGHYRNEAHKVPWLLMGWGAVFRRQWLDCLQPYLNQYGEDEMLYSKFDRLWTVLYGKHDPIPAQYISLTGPDGRRSDTDANALYRQRDHRKLVQQSVERALALRKELAHS